MRCMKRNFGVLVPVTVAFSVFASVLLAVASQASNSWTLLRPGSPLGAYTSITSSIDGTRLATTIAGGNLIISSDSGKTWTSAATSQLWTGIVSSSDGNYLAAINRGNTVWTSSDAGITWQSHIPKSPKRLFSNPESVAISPNGEHLAITSGIGIWTSDDFGENWVVTKISDITFASNIVYAADGRHLIVLGDTHIFTSADSGSSWVVSSGPKLRGRIATSFDGSHLILVSSGNSAQNQAGDIWTSSDDGVSWMPHANHQYWLDVTSSPDGTKLTAIDQVSSTGSSSYTPGDTGIWTSSDSGLTWVNAGTTGIVSPGSRIVSSNDGARLFVSGWGGGIWTGTNASSVNDSAPTKISGNPLSSPSPTETRSVAGSSSCPNYLFVGMRGSGENYSPGSPAGELGSTLASLWSDLSVTTRFQNLKFSGVASYKAEGIALTK